MHNFTFTIAEFIFYLCIVCTFYARFYFDGCLFFTINLDLTISCVSCQMKLFQGLLSSDRVLDIEYCHWSVRLQIRVTHELHNIRTSLSVCQSVSLSVHLKNSSWDCFIFRIILRHDKGTNLTGPDLLKKIMDERSIRFDSDLTPFLISSLSVSHSVIQ